MAVNDFSEAVTRNRCGSPDAAGECRILVTGASGFIGRGIVARLVADGVDVIAAKRSPSSAVRDAHSPSLDGEADWRALLRGRTAVVHAAARAHVLDDQAERPLDVFRAINTAGTLRLAQQATEMGIRRFIFLSSIGVNGVQSTRPFTESDAPAPEEPYAVSKLEAEHALMQLAERTGMEVVILRPPLVYGPDAPGNFGRLLGAVRRGLPLPLGAVTRNRRTLVALENLVDLIVTCVVHPAAANQVFLAGDSEDLSTAELLRRLARAFGVRLRLLPVPVWLLSAGAAALGKRAMVDRLCGSLQVDIGKARELLGWSPPLNVDEALRRTARHYLERDDG